MTALTPPVDDPATLRLTVRSATGAADAVTVKTTVPPSSTLGRSTAIEIVGATRGNRRADPGPVPAAVVFAVGLMTYATELYLPIEYPA